MVPHPLFRVGTTGMLRMAVLPGDRAAATHVDLDPDVPDYPDRLANYLRDVTKDPLLMEAITVSSDQLAATLDRLRSGEPVSKSKLQRAAFAVTRYLLRMSGRPTPFGLFAGVGVTSFGNTTSVRLGEDHVKGVRPDNAWLTSLVSIWERSHEVQSNLRVVANGLCTERAGRVVLPYVREVDENTGARSAGGAEEVSLRATPAVRRALELARIPVTCSDLVESLCRSFAAATADRVRILVDHLIANDVLLTDLRPATTEADPFARLVEAISEDQLAEITDLLAAFRMAAPGEGLPHWHRAVAAMRERTPSRKPPVHVDLRLDVDVRLPPEVGEEARRAAEALWRLAPLDGWPAHLREYHADFSEKYGHGRLVKITELLDPATGLGAPAGYRTPRSERVRRGSERGAETARDHKLARLAQAAMLTGAAEVVLTDADLDSLADKPKGAVPRGLEISVHLCAPTREAIDSGDFTLHISPLVGTSQVGATFGRFAYLFPEHDHFRDLYRVPDEPHTSHLQLVYPTVSPRSGNVVQVPRMVPDQLAIGVFADVDDPHVVDVEDVYISADEDRFHLRSLSRDAEIIPLVPHMLNDLVGVPNVVRLVREVAESGIRQLHAWDWGTAMVLPHHPRVRYGRTVLAPAYWRVPKSLHDVTLPFADWLDELATWRQQWRVPAEVQIVVQDHRVDLDLTVGLHCQVLRDEIRKRDFLVLSEVIGAGPDRFGWLDGHAAELVFPLHRVAPPTRGSRSAPSTATEVPPRHSPGGEWLYAKVYAGSAHHDEILADRLPQLLTVLDDDVDRWFFLRYADPDPHLRLRLHGSPDRLMSSVLPVLREWVDDLRDARLASKFALDDYEPELQRYGGLAAMTNAESVFQADSAAALAELRLRRTELSDVDAALLLAIGHVEMLTATEMPTWQEWLLSTFPKGDKHAAFQQRREQARALVDPSGRWAGLLSRAGGAELLAALGSRTAAVRRYSDGLAEHSWSVAIGALLHMHSNRLGASYDVEAESYAVARGAVQARRNRTRFTT